MMKKLKRQAEKSAFIEGGIDCALKERTQTLKKKSLPVLLDLNPKTIRQSENLLMTTPTGRVFQLAIKKP